MELVVFVSKQSHLLVECMAVNTASILYPGLETAPHAHLLCVQEPLSLTAFTPQQNLFYSYPNCGINNFLRSRLLVLLCC